MSEKINRPFPVREEGHKFDRLIEAVASGKRKPDRAWHQLRNDRPPLSVWMAFATASGRYDAKWAKHQHKCWTELSDAGTYPAQRAKWLRIQERFAADMAARHRPISTRAQLRSMRAPKPVCDVHQLGLAI